MMPIVAEHGAAVVALTIDEEGQARTAEWKVRVAARLIDDLTGRLGPAPPDILVDCLTFPITTGQEETRKDAIETIEAIRQIAQRYPGINFTLGISNVSFGLNPAARQVLNSVFLHECAQAGLTSAIVHASKILPMAKIPDEQREVALDLVYDRRREGYDPLSRFIEMFEGVDAASARASRAEELAALPLDERLQRRIIDGERNGLESDLDEALTNRPALAIINDTLLAGMKTVGELFGSGQMQLPFVLQSAEVMKTAVAYLEPHMEKADDGGKGRIVLATVKGDVHDIGKNLVDIILSNNGYEVVNIGIKQPITAILDAAEEAKADAIGMSGLLVKSTVIMKENLQEMDSRGVVRAVAGPARRRGADPLLRGRRPAGPLLRRGALRPGRVRGPVLDGPGDGGQARRVAGRSTPSARRKLAERRERRERHQGDGQGRPARTRRRVGTLRRRRRRPVPTAPFFGTRVIKGVPLADYVSMLDERAMFLGQWGLRGSRGGAGPSYEELVETEGRPRMRYWLDRLVADKVLEAAVVYGYFPCYSEGNTLVVLDENARGRAGPVHLPAPAQRTAPVHRRLLQTTLRGPRRDRHAAGDDRPAGERVRREAARRPRVPGLLRGARPVGAAGRGTGRVLAPARPLRADAAVRRDAGVVRPARPRRHPRHRLPRLPLLVRLPGLPGPGGPREDRRLLQPERIGVTLSEEFQLDPEQSTDAIIVHHPEANLLQRQMTRRPRLGSRSAHPAETCLSGSKAEHQGSGPAGGHS